jgi:hypothetical protein
MAAPLPYGQRMWPLPLYHSGIRCYAVLSPMYYTSLKWMLPLQNRLQLPSVKGIPIKIGTVDADDDITAMY